MLGLQQTSFNIEMEGTHYTQICIHSDIKKTLQKYVFNALTKQNLNTHPNLDIFIT